MKILYPLKHTPYITQKFGVNRAFYSQYKIGGVALKGHEGLDLRAPIGTIVLACDEGTITEVTDQGGIGYGKYIKVVHSWGESIYAHLQEFKVKKSDKVIKGQEIALADNTGNSTASHLHFGIRISPYNRSDGWGGYSNPEPYLTYQVDDDVQLPMNDQTKIGKDLLNWHEDLELQQVRGLLGDLVRVQKELQELKGNPPQGKVYTKTISKLYAQLADAYESQ